MKLLVFFVLQVVLVFFSAKITCTAADLDVQYRKYQEKLKQETNPVSKTKILIKMSAIDLKEAAVQVRAGNLEEADRFLIRYADDVHQAQEILKNSARNAQKNPSGFRDLELSLHQQLRKLNDLKDSYPYDQQKNLEKALETAKAVQQEMLLAIFGPENLQMPEDRRAPQPRVRP
jgi:hypothetical protein